MIILMEFLWFITYLCTGIAMDMGWYSLFNAHSFSWDLYEVQAFGDMWYIFTTLMLCLYIALRLYRPRVINNVLLLNKNAQYDMLDDHLCDSHKRLQNIRNHIVDVAKKKGLPTPPVVYIEKSQLVRISSCKIRLLSPPVIVISSAAVNGLDAEELRWLIATEISRLYRGASSLYYKNQAMMVTKTLHFLFIGSFVTLWAAISGTADRTSTGSSFSNGQGCLSLVLLIFIVFILLGYGLTALIPLALVISLLSAFLCNRFPDRRYAANQLRKANIAKPQRKAIAKRVKKLLKSKDTFDHDGINGALWSRPNFDFGIEITTPKQIQTLLQNHPIRLAWRYHVRHISRIALGAFISFFLFSYPLFTLYQVAIPEETVKKYSHKADTMSWQPQYQTNFTYRGTSGTITLDFVNIHTADVKVKLGSEQKFRGMAGLHGGCESGVSFRQAVERRSIPCRVQLSFTRLDKISGFTTKQQERFEESITNLLNKKLKKLRFQQGQREGIAIYPIFHFVYPFTALPYMTFVPCDMTDFMNWIANSLESKKI